MPFSLTNICDFATKWWCMLAAFGALAHYSAVVSAAPAPAPETLTQRISHQGTTLTLRLTRLDLRGPNFEYWSQGDDGKYNAVETVGERSYLGVVDEDPGAVASGIRKDDGTFWGAVYFQRGESWFTLGDKVRWKRAANYGEFTDYHFPKAPTVAPGQVGETMRGFEVGIDADHNYFATCGDGDLAQTLESIEYSVAVTRAIYMPNALLRPYLGRVIVRTVDGQDPHRGKKAGEYLRSVREDWNTRQKNTNPDVVAGVSPTKIGGGLAWVGTVGDENKYSLNDAKDATGEFHVVWRHEMGHNWGCNHYVGGKPEGAGLMGGNQPARISGCELFVMLKHRDSRPEGMLDNEGVFTAVNLPPYAGIDVARLPRGGEGAAAATEIAISPLANDHDANAHTLRLVSFDATSHRGGTVRQSGTELIYTPAADDHDEDWFTYSIKDSAGQTARGVVIIGAQPDEAPAEQQSGE